jgi:hypothetical protein
MEGHIFIGGDHICLSHDSLVIEYMLISEANLPQWPS